MGKDYSLVYGAQIPTALLLEKLGNETDVAEFCKNGLMACDGYLVHTDGHEECIYFMVKHDPPSCQVAKLSRVYRKQIGEAKEQWAKFRSFLLKDGVDIGEGELWLAETEVA